MRFLLIALFSFFLSFGACALEQTALQKQQLHTEKTRLEGTDINDLLKCEKKNKFYVPTDPSADADGCVGPGIPSCAADLVLTVSGGSYACTDPVPDCPVGAVLIAKGDGTWECGCQNPLPAGGYIRDGGSIQAYENATVGCNGLCKVQTRTCTNGVLSGSFVNPSCTVGSCACTLPWGGTIANGQSVTAYQTSTVACGQNCKSEVRTCVDGTLTGSYTKKTCSAAPCNCSLPWGGTIAHGASVKAFATEGGCGKTCKAQWRKCNNGKLSGTYRFKTCSTACKSCPSKTIKKGYGWCTYTSPNMAHGKTITVKQKDSQCRYDNNYVGPTVTVSNYSWYCMEGTLTCKDGVLDDSKLRCEENYYDTGA